MKLKNNCGKIVSVGETVILPGETKEVDGYENNAALDFLIERGDLTKIKTAAAKTKSSEPAQTEATAAKTAQDK